MKDEPTWVDLADELEKIKAVQPLRADWFAYVGSEDYGIWLLHPDGRNTDGLRATFSLIAAHAIRKLGIPPIPVPEPLQHCPHWKVYCAVEEDLARRQGEALDLSDSVPYGLDTVDLDAVDPCTRAFLELLRRESRAFGVSSTGTDIIKGTAYPTIDGTIDDLCGAAAAYCKRRARDEIGARSEHSESVEISSKIAIESRVAPAEPTSVGLSTGNEALSESAPSVANSTVDGSEAVGVDANRNSGQSKPAMVASNAENVQQPDAELERADNKDLGQRLTSAQIAQQTRARTVARLIGELDSLKPQMFEDETEYNELRAQYPDFLAFKIAEMRPDLKRKILAIRGSIRHILLAQELAAAHYGREVSTIQEDWKNFKPAEFRRPK
jgi:hypothetical protein